MRSIDVIAASTKLYDDLYSSNKSSCDSDDSGMREDSSTDEKEVNQRWGCLKRVLSDEHSGW